MSDAAWDALALDPLAPNGDQVELYYAPPPQVDGGGIVILASAN